MAKLLAARVAWANADNALQIHGGNGFALEYPISRVLCDARILNIFEGAAEIQAGPLVHQRGQELAEQVAMRSMHLDSGESCGTCLGSDTREPFDHVIDFARGHGTRRHVHRSRQVQRHGRRRDRRRAHMAGRLAARMIDLHPQVIAGHRSRGRKALEAPPGHRCHR
jgi:hypothetical protein